MYGKYEYHETRVCRALEEVQAILDDLEPEERKLLDERISSRLESASYEASHTLLGSGVLQAPSAGLFNMRQADALQQAMSAQPGWLGGLTRYMK